MKKALKRSLSLLLAITIILGSAYVGLGEVDFEGLFAVKAKAATSGTTGDCTWSLDGTVLTISGNGEMGDYTSSTAVPWDKKITKVIIKDGVTSIGSFAFEGCTSLTSITIPNSVTSIGNSAFSACTSLTSVTIPDSVTSIEHHAFFNCKNLTSITIPDGVTSICDYTFHTCYALISITIPNSVTSIGDGAFYGCTNLTSITIPDGVTNICNWVFEYCTNLTSITIPNSVTSIGSNAFYECTHLKNVYYKGFETDRSLVSIFPGNGYLLNATWHYAKASKPATPKATTTNEIGGIQVTWNAVDGATKYVVFRRQGGYSTWVNVGTTTGTTLLDKNVESGIYYIYSVRAYNVSGGYSDYVTSMTNTRKYMAVPKLTGISNATNGLYIKWNPVSGVTKGYRVYRRGAGSVHWYYLGTVKTNYFTDTTIKNNSGEYYRYTVIADGGYHSKFDTTGLYLKRLANPTLTSAVSSKSGITVKWGSVKTATDYYVYRKTANSGWVRIATLPGNRTTSYLDKTAKKGTTYTYTVRACSGSTISYFNSGISCKDRY